MLKSKEIAEFTGLLIGDVENLRKRGIISETEDMQKTVQEIILSFVLEMERLGVLSSLWRTEEGGLC